MELPECCRGLQHKLVSTFWVLPFASATPLPMCLNCKDILEVIWIVRGREKKSVGVLGQDFVRLY